jgi:hypothetical protein
MSSHEPKKKFASPLDRAVVDSHDIWEKVANGERVDGPQLLSEAAVAAIVENVIATDLLVRGETAGVRQRAPTEKPREKTDPRGPETTDKDKSDQGIDPRITRGAEVTELYKLLMRLATLAKGNKSESELRGKYETAFKTLWDAIDRSKTLKPKEKKDFFRMLTDAGESDRYEFIANILGSTPNTVRGWRFWKPKPKK